MVHVSCYVTKIKAILENIFKNITLVTKKYKKIIKNHKKKTKKNAFTFRKQDKTSFIICKVRGSLPIFSLLFNCCVTFKI